MEIWRDIPGYIGLYQASSEGRIRSLDRTICQEFILSGVRVPRSGGGIRKPGEGYAGRLGVILSAYGEQKRLQVHRLVLMAFRGVPAEDLDGLHNDGDHLNNRPENLRWGTHTDNMRDKVRHGTNTEGEKHPNVKLTEDDVRAIRSSNWKGRDLAAHYGVSQVCIVFIKNRRTWKRVA